MASSTNRGYRVALITDRRPSGEQGNASTAIHVTPEAEGGGLAHIREGNVIRLGLALPAETPINASDLAARSDRAKPRHNPIQKGRELFRIFRQNAQRAKARH